MDFHLINPESFEYPEHVDGITLPVKLSSGAYVIEAFAKVDSGAGVCLFSREIGAHLDLDIEQGIPNTLRTLSGSIESFGHDVTLEVGALAFHTTVYFAKHPGLPRNFLGRQGFLRNVRIGIVDYENTLYFAKYELQ